MGFFLKRFLGSRGSYAVFKGLRPVLLEPLSWNLDLHTAKIRKFTLNSWDTSVYIFSQRFVTSVAFQCFYPTLLWSSLTENSLLLLLVLFALPTLTYWLLHLHSTSQYSILLNMNYSSLLYTILTCSAGLTEAPALFHSDLFYFTFAQTFPVCISALS